MMKSDDWQKYFYSNIHLVACAVAIKMNGATEFIGSAVYIAPGLFVTAKHVIEEPLKRTGHLKQIHENKKFGQYDANLSASEFILEVVQFPKLEAENAQRWNISKLRFSHDYDFAILTANDAEGPIDHLLSTLPSPEINLHPILESNEVVSCGFYKGAEEKEGTITSHQIIYTGRPGKVTNFHLELASVAGIGVYEIDNHMEHMMSGGPVINHEGSVIAVNSSGFYEGGNRTIATPFIRGMFMKFDYLTNGRIINTSLYELAQKGFLKITGIEHLSQEGDKIKWSPSKLCDYCYPNDESKKKQKTEPEV
jgi:S1-C subfamily serine protease